MAEVTMDMIKKLREWSGAGIMDCKGALKETNGDMDAAMELLRKRRADVAAKKSHRETKSGMIGSYLHVRDDGGVPGSGVLVDVNCETDFAARSDLFKAFVNNVALHIAAAGPEYLAPEDVPAEVLEKEREVMREQMVDSGKPAEMVEKIIDGKLRKYYEENCLLEQTFALAQDKSEQKSISQMLKETIGSIGENMSIRRFARFDLEG
jgi:elongation factor Ts